LANVSAGEYNRLTNKAIAEIKIINPIDFVREMEDL
jgi:hypothetical protein